MIQMTQDKNQKRRPQQQARMPLYSLPDTHKSVADSRFEGPGSYDFIIGILIFCCLAKATASL